MVSLLITLALLVFLVPAQAEPRGKIVTDPEILKLLKISPNTNPIPSTGTPTTSACSSMWARPRPTKL